MKFKYYIVDLDGGNVRGTDDNRVALDFSQSEEYFVIDAQDGEWLDVNSTKKIEEYE